MAKINFVVKIGSGASASVIAGQRGATLNRSMETIDMTTNDSDGWKEFVGGYREWGIDCDGLVIKTGAGFSEMETAFIQGDEVSVEFSAGTGLPKYSGKALITDFPIESAYDDTATYSVSFQGTKMLGYAASATLSEV